MSWEQRSKPTVVKATVKLAKEFMEMEAAHVDRPLSERRLNVYRNIRATGEFRPVTWARAWCEETKQWYRVNGKHTSTLFSDGQDLDGLSIILEEYTCETLEDVAKLYATFDSGVAARNSTDINRSFASTIPELREFSTNFINICVSALNYVPTHGTGGSPGKTAAERAEELFDNVGLCVWLHDLLGSGHTGASKHLWRMSVVAAIIGTYRKSQKASWEFWLAVRDETGQTPDKPDRKLAKFLITSSVHTGGRSNTPARFRVSNREFYVKCVNAWNAWRDGGTTQLKYFVDAKLPAIK